jgi:hypothetical protein
MGRHDVIHAVMVYESCPNCQKGEDRDKELKEVAKEQREDKIANRIAKWIEEDSYWQTKPRALELAKLIHAGEWRNGS